MSGTSSAARGVHQVGLETTVATALDNFRREVSKEIKELKTKVDKCEVCRGGHGTLECPMLTEEQVEFITGQPRGPTNPFNNNNPNYNSNWCNNNNNFRSSGNPLVSKQVKIKTGGRVNILVGVQTIRVNFLMGVRRVSLVQGVQIGNILVGVQTVKVQITKTWVVV